MIETFAHQLEVIHYKSTQKVIIRGNKMYLLINNNGFTIKDGIPDLETMQQLVGNPREKAFIECVYHEFADKSIVLICDDSFLYKNFKPTCITERGLTLHGQVLALKLEFENLIGLTNKQVRLIKERLTIVH